MEVKDVVIKRYAPSNGKALKVTRNIESIDGKKEEYTVYTKISVLVVEDELSSPVEEVGMEEYDEWNKIRNLNLNEFGFASLI